MNEQVERMRQSALGIWRAGVDAVRPERLIPSVVRVEGRQLRIADAVVDLDKTRRIAVVGAGKASGAMAAALESAIGPSIDLAEKRLAGWVNVPDPCVRPLFRFHLHGARPAGINEPTEAAVRGTEQILRLVGLLGPEDVCICLISGGGSALLPAPIEGITLADKVEVTRHLSAAGADITELNTVRKQLSRVKGGGLARACRAGRLITLIISDVMGDPLEVIASGPTVEDSSTPEPAISILERYAAREIVSQRVFDVLHAARAQLHPPASCRVENFIIGNLQTAIDAAAGEAVLAGFDTTAPPIVDEGTAEQAGESHADEAIKLFASRLPSCRVTGGEPTVRLVDESRRGRGGRNQQLALAALERLKQHAPQRDRLLILSGGTDGEDGPTDAAGAFADSLVWAAATQQRLDVADYLARNDAYTFFEMTGGLLRTGPTETNVGDLRVTLVW